MENLMNYLNWDYIREVSKDNVYIESSFILWEKEPDMTPEQVLMHMVLMQHKALKTVPNWLAK